MTTTTIEDAVRDLERDDVLATLQEVEWYGDNPAKVTTTDPDDAPLTVVNHHGEALTGIEAAGELRSYLHTIR